MKKSDLPTDIKFGKVVSLIPKTRKGKNFLQNTINFWCIQSPEAINPPVEKELCLIELSPNGKPQKAIWVEKDNDPDFSIDWNPIFED